MISTHKNIFDKGDIDLKGEKALRNDSDFVISSRNIIPSNENLTTEKIKKKVKKIIEARKDHEKEKEQNLKKDKPKRSLKNILQNK